MGSKLSWGELDQIEKKRCNIPVILINPDRPTLNECNRLWVLKKYVSGTAFSAASAAAKFFFSLFG
jgi:hypothetical protein